MITKFLLRWREARRQKYIQKILVTRAGLLGRLDGYKKAGYTGTNLLGEIAECNEILRQFGHKDQS